tara:strand:+ start:546 stop:1295 length:750 start_codon:yes stop_codon:yes gene_type:complete
MATGPRRITVQELISRVKQVFPTSPDAYILNLINDAILEIGKYGVKIEYVKTNSILGQRWYNLSDASGIEINKVLDVSYMDDSGNYIKVPRLLNYHVIPLTDTDETVASPSYTATSGYSNPAEYIRWWIEHDQLAIVTDKSGSWESIDESVTSGILLHFYAEPEILAIDDTFSSTYPDLDNSMHLPIVDYVKRCLFMDKAGATPDPNASQISIMMSQQHDMKWRESVDKWIMIKKDKTGGPRVLAVPKL